MWSLYSNNAGFAIEFDYSLFPFRFHGPFPMNYKASFEKVTIKRDADKLILMLYMSNIKNENWKYENEWRLIIDSPKNQPMFSPKIDILKRLGGHNRKFSYPKEAVRSISLGNHFFETEELTIENPKTLSIILKDNVIPKTIVLDYADSNQILTKIITRKTSPRNSFELDSREGYIQKIAANQYQFKATD